MVSLLAVLKGCMCHLMVQEVGEPFQIVWLLNKKSGTSILYGLSGSSFELECVHLMFIVVNSR